MHSIGKLPGAVWEEMLDTGEIELSSVAERFLHAKISPWSRYLGTIPMFFKNNSNKDSISVACLY